MLNYLKIIELSAAILFICILIQAIIWNLKKIKNELIVLLTIFSFTPLILFLILNNLIIFLSRSELINTVVLTYSLSLAYIQTYPALKEDIPSIKILSLIKHSGKISKKELIKNHLLNDSLINSKQEELINDGFIFKQNRKIKVTKIGFLLAKIFIFYRNILNLKDSTG